MAGLSFESAIICWMTDGRHVVCNLHPVRCLFGFSPLFDSHTYAWVAADRLSPLSVSHQCEDVLRW